MREILFRGKRIDTNEWVFGYPLRSVCNAGSAWMMYIPAANPDENTHTVFVDESTLGIWTGLHDENEKKIFHGDIGVLTVFDREGQDYQYNVEAIFDDAYGLCFNEVPSRDNGGWWDYGCYDFDLESQFEIIGNRWDNPELLGGARDGN